MNEITFRKFCETYLCIACDNVIERVTEGENVPLILQRKKNVFSKYE